MAGLQQHRNMNVSEEIEVDCGYEKITDVSTDWQVGRSVLERLKYMLANKVNCDVTFKFKEDADKESSVQAHKCILASSSPVFFAMFDASTIEKEGGAIFVPDVNRDSFMEMLRFIYFEEVTLKDNNVMEVFSLANQYKLSQLASKCEEFLKNSLNAGNVCTLLPHAIQLDQEELVERCFKIIDTQTKIVLTSETFLTISNHTLLLIVKRNSLEEASEIDIFFACVRWAEKECERKGLDPNPENERNVLGAVLFEIRFPNMTGTEIADMVEPREILSKDEILSVLLCVAKSGQGSDDLPFSTESRASHYEYIKEETPRQPEIKCTHCSEICTRVGFMGAECSKCEVLY